MIPIASHFHISDRSSARKMGHIAGSFKLPVGCETDKHILLLVLARRTCEIVVIRVY
jgi:hypothetical protein